MYDSTSRRQTLVKATDDMWWMSPVDKGLRSRPIAIACEGTLGKVTSKVSAESNRAHRPNPRESRECFLEWFFFVFPSFPLRRCQYVSPLPSPPLLTKTPSPPLPLAQASLPRSPARAQFPASPRQGPSLFFQMLTPTLRGCNPLYFAVGTTWPLLLLCA